MKILLLYPSYPDTFWSFKHALKYISKKALMPPLGLLTIAPLLPAHFEKRLIDMNVSTLSDSDLLWADYIFISAMITQKESVFKIAKRCRELCVKTVAGGPMFSELHSEFDDIDHFVLGEGEITIPLFLKDLEQGHLKRIYSSTEKPDISTSPIPDWSLINFKHYSKMPIQFSRGCPFNCEFCDIVNLNGRVPRTKTPAQVIAELEALIKHGWKESIFLVDDNFIGNKEKSKALLRELAKWRKEKKRKFVCFMTEVSLNVSDDDELLVLMREAGFNSVFIGLETPSEESLAECGKFQNKNKDLVASVKKLYSAGIGVTAGFIVGFDSDDTSIFSRQIEFIQKTGVVVAMVGLLQALPGTRLYERLKSENRLVADSSGNNTDFSINFLPKIDKETLINGHRRIIDSIYSAPMYYERILTFLKNYKACNNERLTYHSILALIKSIFILGIFHKERKYYWKLFFIGVFRYPHSFSQAISYAIYYDHFRKIFNPQVCSSGSV